MKFRVAVCKMKVMFVIWLLTCTQCVICRDSGNIESNATVSRLTAYSVLEGRNGVGNLSDSALKTLKSRFLATKSRSRNDKLYSDFEIWNTLRHSDGFLCRNDGDCQWIYRALECQEEEVVSSSTSDPLVKVCIQHFWC